jgi:hypothetical protein
MNLNSHYTKYVISCILMYLVPNIENILFIDGVLCFKYINMPNIFRSILLCLKHYNCIHNVLKFTIGI